MSVRISKDERATGDCDALKHNGEKCSRTAEHELGILRLCHQHVQVAELDPKAAKLWRQKKAAGA